MLPMFSHNPLIIIFMIFNYIFIHGIWSVSFSPVLCLVAWSCPTLYNPVDCRLPGSSVHGDFPGKNAGKGCHALLQGNLSNARIPCCRQILHHLSHHGSPLSLLLDCKYHKERNYIQFFSLFNFQHLRQFLAHTRYAIDMCGANAENGVPSQRPEYLGSSAEHSFDPQGTLPRWHEGKTGTETLPVQKVP